MRQRNVFMINMNFTVKITLIWSTNTLYHMKGKIIENARYRIIIE